MIGAAFQTGYAFGDARLQGIEVLDHGFLLATDLADLLEIQVDSLTGRLVILSLLGSQMLHKAVRGI